MTRACVSDYRGSEIPDADRWGLDPDKIYALLRDPDELKRAVSTFDSLPVLSHHVPVNSVSPGKQWVVGSTGSDARFDAPYLTNSLVIWDQGAIDDVESSETRELSCGYRFEFVPESGTYQGERFFGRMTKISGSHVAIVPRGRVPGCLIGDAAPTWMDRMSRSREFIRQARGFA